MSLQVLKKKICIDLPGEALLADMMGLVSDHPANQALMCLQARQQMQLGRLGDALRTVSGFVGVGSGVVASHWALHITVHVRWLTGGLDQVGSSLYPLL